MSWPRSIMFIRHAESLTNAMPEEEATRLPLGSHRYPLSEKGVHQSRILGKHLAERFGDTAFDTIVSSYYERATHTAQLAFPGCDVRIDERLAERRRGLRHSMTEAEYFAVYPGEDERWKREGPFHYGPLGGESGPDVMLRVRSFIQTLRSDFRHQSVVIVGHSHWYLFFQMAMHRITIAEYERRITAFELLKNAAYARYQAPSPGQMPTILEEEVVPWHGLLEETPNARQEAGR